MRRAYRFAAAFALALVVSGSVAAAAIQFDLEWKTKGLARGVTTGNGRHVFVATSRQGTTGLVQEFGASGKPIRAFGDSHNHLLSDPEDVAVDSAGHVFVSDPGVTNRRISEFSSSGKFIRHFGTFKGSAHGDGPSGLATARGRLYAADTDNDRISEFSTSGKFIRAWGKRGNDAGEFRHPNDVAIGPKRHVYVADTGNNRIQEFSPSGKFIRAFAKQNGSHGVEGIAVAPSGGVIAVYGYADSKGLRVFSPHGKLVETYSFPRPTDGFTYPGDVAIGARRAVFVADWNNRRVERFSNFRFR